MTLVSCSGGSRVCTLVGFASEVTVGADDGVEVTFGLNPLDGTDAALDNDTDGLTNAEEIALGTDLAVADSDRDGLIDGTNPLDMSDDVGVASSMPPRLRQMATSLESLT